MTTKHDLKARMETPVEAPKHLYVAILFFYDGPAVSGNIQHAEVEDENAAGALTKLFDRFSHRSIQRLQLYRVKSKVTDLELEHEEQ